MKILKLSCAALLVAACGDNTAGTLPDGGPDEPDAAGGDPDAEVPPAPGLTLLDFHFAIDITPDGRTAVFELLTETEATIHLHDTVTGISKLGTVLGDPARNLATGVSADVRISAYQGEPVQAAVWDPAGSWTAIPSSFASGCDADLGSAFDISADGRSVVGLMWNDCAPQAFVAVDDDVTLLQVLGTGYEGSKNPPTNRATVISDDGSVIAGFAQNGNLDRTPAVWNPADGTGVLLDPDQTDAPGEVLSISADGKTLAGVRGLDGFVWTRGTGFVTLARLDGYLPGDAMFPNAIAADGTLVFGGCGSPFFSLPSAFVWTAEEGTRALADVARAAGVTIPEGLQLENVLGASEDGTVLIGTASTADFQLKTFVLRLPAGAFTASS